MTDENEIERAAREYRIKRGWPTKSQWLDQYKDGLMAYEIGYEVEDAFTDGVQWARSTKCDDHSAKGNAETPPISAGGNVAVIPDGDSAETPPLDVSELEKIFRLGADFEHRYLRGAHQENEANLIVCEITSIAYAALGNIERLRETPPAASMGVSEKEIKAMAHHALAKD